MINWRAEGAAEGVKPRKVAIDPLDGRAKRHMPFIGIAQPFGRAAASVITNKNIFHGIGRVIIDRDNLICIDLDQYKFAHPLIDEIKEHFRSLIEYGPSGEGSYHVWCRVDTPTLTRIETRKVGLLGCIDILGPNSYATVTGRIYRDEPIIDGTKLVTHILDLAGVPLTPSVAASNDVPREFGDLEEIIERASLRRSDLRDRLTQVVLRASGIDYSSFLAGILKDFAAASAPGDAVLQILSTAPTILQSEAPQPVDGRPAPTTRLDKLNRVFAKEWEKAWNETVTDRATFDTLLAVRWGNGALLSPVTPVDGSAPAPGTPALAPVITDDTFWHPDPIDHWGELAPPEFTPELLPSALYDFARVKSRIQGSDVAGFAIGGLTVAANVITSRIKIRVKRMDDWYERPCLWSSLVGEPSTKKSPIFEACIAPVYQIEKRLSAEFREKVEAFEQAQAAYDAADKDQRANMERPVPPVQRRLMLNDTTVESVQEIMLETQERLFCVRDELGGWYANQDRYVGGNAQGSDSAFWLQTFNGKPYAVDRIKRGRGRMIDCCLVGLFGGIQPDRIREVVDSRSNDGTLQRQLPIMLRDAVKGVDDAAGLAATIYNQLIDRLFRLTAEDIEGGTHEHGGVLHFSAGASNVRDEIETWVLAASGIQEFDRRLAQHILKYEGIFARLAMVFHLIEYSHFAPDRRIPKEVSEATASRAANFLKRYLFPHACAFYGGVLMKTKAQSVAKRLADHILAHGLRKVLPADFRGLELERKDIDAGMYALETSAWCHRVTGIPRKDSVYWIVNDEVHGRYEEQAILAKARLAKALASRDASIMKRRKELT